MQSLGQSFEENKNSSAAAAANNLTAKPGKLELTGFLILSPVFATSLSLRPKVEKLNETPFSSPRFNANIYLHLIKPSNSRSQNQLHSSCEGEVEARCVAQLHTPQDEQRNRLALGIWPMRPMPINEMEPRSRVMH